MTDPVFLATLASEIEEIARGGELNDTNARIDLFRLALRCRSVALAEIQRRITLMRISEERALFGSYSDDSPQT